MRYKQSLGDYTLFIEHTKGGNITNLLVYVDDIFVNRNDETEKDRILDIVVCEF